VPASSFVRRPPGYFRQSRLIAEFPAEVEERCVDGVKNIFINLELCCASALRATRHIEIAA
jgi:hypothetical protein